MICDCSCVASPAPVRDLCLHSRLRAGMCIEPAPESPLPQQIQNVLQAPKEKKAKRPASASAASPRAPEAKAAKTADTDRDAGAKKKRKKKDKNAPKGALSAFMYFSNANRDQVRLSLRMLATESFPAIQVLKANMVSLTAPDAKRGRTCLV